jgi:signal transduction histidine kinase
LYEPKDIFIDADKDRIVQVISNILNNAVKSVKEKEGGGGGDRGEEERQITIITQIGVEK